MEALRRGLSAFLSCLYGSQLYGKDAPAHYQFLSCLYGSQRSAVARALISIFLSCLYGSQLKIRFFACGEYFLSCLYGSQLTEQAKAQTQSFSKLPIRQSTQDSFLCVR